MAGRAIVLGDGVNELVAAHLLAKSGRETILLCSGRGSDAEEGWVAPQVARALGVEGKISTHEDDPWAVAALPEGGKLELHGDVARSAASIARLSARDAQAWPQFCDRMARLAGFLERLSLQPAPDPLAGTFALGMRRLGREGMTDLMRTLPMPVSELLDEWFETDALKGLLAACAVRRLQQGPRSAGTAFRLLHSHAGRPTGRFRAPRTGLRKVLRALPGLSMRAAEPEEILVKEGRVAGVRLAGGEELASALVVSGADPRRTLLDLMDPAWHDPTLVRAVRNIRSRGVMGRLRLELERPAQFTTLTVSPSIDYVEKAYDDSKYGRASARPVLDARADGVLVEVEVQYVPYPLDQAAFAAAAQAVLAEVVPGLAVQRAEAMGPRELEIDEGWPQGQADHAELALDQAFWARPIPELARYRTPIGGLWLCGPAMHPGAAVAGAAGYLCVREILRE